MTACSMRRCRAVRAPWPALQSGLLKDHADFIPDAIDAIANLLHTTVNKNRQRQRAILDSWHPVAGEYNATCKQKRRRRGERDGIETKRADAYREQAHFEELAVPSRGLRFGLRLRLGLGLGLGVGLAIVCDIGEAEVGGAREQER